MRAYPMCFEYTHRHDVKVAFSLRWQYDVDGVLLVMPILLIDVPACLKGLYNTHIQVASVQSASGPYCRPLHSPASTKLFLKFVSRLACCQCFVCWG